MSDVKPCWQDKPPTEPGIYWYADETGRSLCEIARHHPAFGAPRLLARGFGDEQVFDPSIKTIWWSERVMPPEWQ